MKTYQEIKDLAKSATGLMAGNTWELVKGYIRDVVVPTVGKSDGESVWTALYSEFLLWDGQKAHWQRRVVDCNSGNCFYMFLAMCGSKWEAYGKDAKMKQK